MSDKIIIAIIILIIEWQMWSNNRNNDKQLGLIVQNIQTIIDCNDKNIKAISEDFAKIKKHINYKENNGN